VKARKYAGAVATVFREPERYAIQFGELRHEPGYAGVAPNWSNFGCRVVSELSPTSGFPSGSVVGNVMGSVR
jgi:hypothetical protein